MKTIGIVGGALAPRCLVYIGRKKGRRVKVNNPSKSGHCKRGWSVAAAITEAQSFHILVAVS
jgi:hypothetical protein